MSDRIERELELEASIDAVWSAVISDGWLAEEVDLDLWPGGDARFRSGESEKIGWIEDVCPPAGDLARLTFWWAADDEPATRVELTIEDIAVDAGRSTRLRVVETRPLDLLDLVGTPLPGPGGVTYGPALVAA